MNVDLTPLVNAIIGIAATLLTTVLLPYIVKKMKREDRLMLLSIIETAVYAADKLKVTGVINDKMKYVIDDLASHGYKLDRTAVEAEVKKLDIAQAFKDGLCAPDPVDGMSTK